MKECDTLGVKTYYDPSCIFSESQDPKPPRIYAPAVTYDHRTRRREEELYGPRSVSEKQSSVGCAVASWRSYEIRVSPRVIM